MAKSYAKWGGIILLVLGVIGLFTALPLGLNSDILEDLIHIVAGALLTYAGMRGTDAQAASWSRIFGIIFLIVGVVGFLSKDMFRLLPGGLDPIDNIVHLAYGVLGWWAARGYKMA